MSELSINDIFPNRLKILCGAGISLNSGIPLANHFLKKLFVASGFNDTFADKAISYGLPFETWLKLFIDYNRYLDNYHYIFDMFTAERLKPNKNHFLIASLVRSGIVKDVYTVNFDLLLEKAYEEIGMHRGTDYEVFYREEDFIKMNETNLPRLIKLHGSAEDYNSMVITIDKAASMNQTKYRDPVVREMMKRNDEENLLILGYSCSDVFDIVPAIESDHNEHCKIIHVMHDQDKKAQESLPDYWPKIRYKEYQGHMLRMNTDELVSNLYRHYNLSLQEIEPSIDSNQLFMEYVAPMFETYVYKSSKRLLQVEMLNMLNEFDTSNNLIQNIIDGPSMEEMFMLKSHYSLKAKNQMNMGCWEDALTLLKLEINVRLSEIATFLHDYDCIQISIDLYNNDYISFIDKLSKVLWRNKEFLQENIIGLEGLWWDNSVGILGALCSICSCFSELSYHINIYGILDAIWNVISKYPSLNPNEEVRICILNLKGILYTKDKRFSESVEQLEAVCAVEEYMGDITRLSLSLANLFNSYYFIKDYETIENKISKYIAGQRVIIEYPINIIIHTAIVYNDTELLGRCLNIITGFNNKNGDTYNLDRHFTFLIKKWFDNMIEYHDLLNVYLNSVTSTSIKTRLRDITDKMEEMQRILYEEGHYRDAALAQYYTHYFRSYC